ncbi:MULTISPECIES: hypothetical protein [unclassified Sphingomonas]|uniref:hypothetical protein n=1 Tax=unclassified Sphingomonas TaxID=196159 RepID=UPI001F58184E|nr:MULTISPECIES: hypothetical protein [unclassified Sphingomonas]
MTRLDIGAVLRDAWAMAKRDRDVLLGVCGLLLLVPQVALAMFVARPPALPGAAEEMTAWLAAVQAWSQLYSLPVIVLSIVLLLGSATVLSLYLDRSHPTVQAAVLRALSLLPRVVLLSLLMSFPVSVGTLLLFLPGLYLQGRLLLALPLLIDTPSIGVIAAFTRSFALTRGHGLILLGVACITVLLGDILALPFRSVGAALQGAPLANPVVAAMLEVGAAAGVTIGMVATLLIQVALYRRLNTGT